MALRVLKDRSSVCLNVLVHREGSISVQPGLDMLILNAACMDPPLWGRGSCNLQELKRKEVKRLALLVDRAR